ALTPAPGAYGHRHELPEGAGPDVAHLTGPMAFGTRLDGRARFGTVAVATGTHLHPGHLDGFLRAKRGLPKLHLDLHLQVPAPRGAPGPLAGAAGKHLEDLREEIAEGIKAPRATEAAGAKGAKAPGTGAPGPVKGRVSKAVVLLPGLGVAQDAIGLANLLELFLGLGIVFVHVGMVLARQPPERPLDLLLRRVPADPQHLVVIPLGRQWLHRPPIPKPPGQTGAAGHAPRRSSSPDTVYSPSTVAPPPAPPVAPPPPGGGWGPAPACPAVWYARVVTSCNALLRASRPSLMAWASSPPTTDCSRCLACSMFSFSWGVTLSPRSFKVRSTV